MIGSKISGFSQYGLSICLTPSMCVRACMHVSVGKDMHSLYSVEYFNVCFEDALLHFAPVLLLHHSLCGNYAKRNR